VKWKIIEHAALGYKILALTGEFYQATSHTTLFPATTIPFAGFTMQLNPLFTLAILVLGVVANPLEGRSGPSVEVAKGSSLTAVPIHGEFTVQGAIPTTGVASTNANVHTGIIPHPDLPNPLPSVPALIICSSQACLGTCLEFAFSELPIDQCLTSNSFAFESAMAWSPTGAGFTFGVGVLVCAFSINS